MSDGQEPIIWITKNGKHIPIFIDNVSDDEKKKASDIEKNTKQANKLNGKLTKSSTPEEIKNHYKDNYNIDIDDSYFANGNDSQFLIDSASQLDKVYSEFPELRNENPLLIAKNFETDKSVPEKYKKATALSYTGTREIWLNDNAFKQYEDLKSSYLVNVDLENKYPLSTTASSILIHELGHKLEVAVARKIGVSEKSLDLSTTSEMIVKFAYADISSNYGFKTLQEARENISKYAGKTFEILPGVEVPVCAETFAEAFSDYIANGNNAKPLSNAIIHHVKKILH